MYCCDRRPKASPGRKLIYVLEDNLRCPSTSGHAHLLGQKGMFEIGGIIDSGSEPLNALNLGGVFRTSIYEIFFTLRPIDAGPPIRVNQ